MNKTARYIRDNELSIFVVLGMIVFTGYLFFNFNLKIIETVAEISSGFIFWGAAYYGRDRWMIEKYLGKHKSLTPEDVRNIFFVKKWEKIRERGILRYCITDGGIILGAYLWILVSILGLSTVVTLKIIMEDPSNMFSFIGYSYMIGGFTGVITNRLRWTYNESRFIRLTDPLNERLQQKHLQDY
ncbi:hypothetical protein [Mucilaginibacter dorajii]|uniref:Uncharacterized protein n=1 Tax=Mucilaginibacter dorajii TaxID=692994 RepID=A0ABP7PK75_9SPHI|nr:hypothetical protein [Mucilaginibacter dorajii]MCS3733545.1 hypothetical protein [Mucilaginibacter dorajii]